MTDAPEYKAAEVLMMSSRQQTVTAPVRQELAGHASCMIGSDDPQTELLDGQLQIRQHQCCAVVH